jgi:polar amino acid transport system substrate-binding protein
VLFPGKLKVATPQLIDLGIRLIARKDEQGEHLVEHFNQGLAKVKEEGEYERLFKRWELVSPK